MSESISTEWQITCVPSTAELVRSSKNSANAAQLQRSFRDAARTLEQSLELTDASTVRTCIAFASIDAARDHVEEGHAQALCRLNSTHASRLLLAEHRYDEMRAKCKHEAAVRSACLDDKHLAICEELRHTICATATAAAVTVNRLQTTDDQMIEANKRRHLETTHVLQSEMKSMIETLEREFASEHATYSIQTGRMSADHSALAARAQAEEYSLDQQNAAVEALGLQLNTLRTRVITEATLSKTNNSAICTERNRIDIALRAAKKRVSMARQAQCSLLRRQAESAHAASDIIAGHVDLGERVLALAAAVERLEAQTTDAVSAGRRFLPLFALKESLNEGATHGSDGDCMRTTIATTFNIAGKTLLDKCAVHTSNNAANTTSGSRSSVQVTNNADADALSHIDGRCNDAVVLLLALKREKAEAIRDVTEQRRRLRVLWRASTLQVPSDLEGVSDDEGVLKVVSLKRSS